MMKFFCLSLLLLLTLETYAESPCDLRPGTSIGVKVVEFTSGNTIHSKIPMKETTAEALLEEMINLQDMGVCEERIIARKCTIKFEKRKNKNFVSMYRGVDRWNTWNLHSKTQVQDFIKRLKKVGFCS